jgi:hypothetical protein
MSVCSCSSCQLRASWMPEECAKFDREDIVNEAFELTGIQEDTQFMSDEIDLATEASEAYQDAAIDQTRRQAQAIPKGEPGECESCGEYFARLVDKHCGRCRDELHLL